jgi:hypothetical protein
VAVYLVWQEISTSLGMAVYACGPKQAHIICLLLLRFNGDRDHVVLVQKLGQHKSSSHQHY